MSNSKFHMKKISILVVAALSFYFPVGIAADIDVNEESGSVWSSGSNNTISLMDDNYTNKTDAQTILRVTNQGKIELNRVTATVEGDSKALVSSLDGGEMKLSGSTLSSSTGETVVALNNSILELSNSSRIVSSIASSSGLGVHLSGRQNQVSLNNSTIEGNNGIIAVENSRSTIDLTGGAKIVASGTEGRGVVLDGGLVSLSGNNTTITANSYGVYEQEKASVSARINTTVNVGNGASISATNGVGVALNNQSNITVTGNQSRVTGRVGISTGSTATINIANGAQVSGSQGAGIAFTRGAVNIRGASSSLSGTTGISVAENSTITVNNGGTITGTTGAGIALAKGGTINVSDANSTVIGATGITATENTTVTLNRGATVTGATGTGIALAKGGTVNVSDTNSKVVGASGITAAESITVTLSRGATVTGATGTGIALAKGGTVNVSGAGTQVSGKTGISSGSADLALNVSNGAAVSGASDLGVNMARGTITADGKGSSISGTTGIAASDSVTITVSDGAAVTGNSHAAINLAKGGKVEVTGQDSAIQGSVGIISSGSESLDLALSSGATVVGRTDTGVNLQRGSVSVNNASISGVSGITAAESSTVTLSRGATVTGATGTGIALAKGGTVNVSGAGTQVSGKTGISSGSADLALNVSNGAAVSGASDLGVNMARGTITADGKGSSISGTTGIAASDSATITVSDGAAVTGNSHAAINLAKGGKVVVTGQDSVIRGKAGVNSGSNGSLDIEVTEGASVFGEQYGINLHGGQITVDGMTSSIQSEQSGVIVEEASTQINIQQGAKIAAKREAITIKNSDNTLINLTGAGSELSGNIILKLYGSKDTTVNLGEGTLISAIGGSVIETDNQTDINLVVNGNDQIINTQQAHGINLTGQQAGNNSIKLKDLTINAQDPTSHAVIIDRNSTSENQLKLTNTHLNTLDSSTILLKQGNLSLALDNSTVEGRQTVLEVLDGLESSRTQLHLSNNSKLLGDLVNSSSKAMLDLSLESHSILKGATTHIGTLDITDSSSQWYVRSDSSLNNIINNGRIYFRETGNIGATLAVGRKDERFKSIRVKQNYIANSGWLDINTVLAGENSPSDKLIVVGNTAGTTFVKINNIAGEGGRVINGIEVVNVAGKSDGVFVQDKRYSVGGYEYTLYKGRLNNTEDGNWFLYSTAHPYIGAYLANRMAALTLFNSRLSERIGHSLQLGKNRSQDMASSIWVYATGSRINSSAAERDLKLRTSINSIQLGGSLVQSLDNNFNIGVMLGHGKGQTTVDNQRHYNNLNILNSTGNIEGYNVGLYTTWKAAAVNNSGTYLGSSLQYGRFNNGIQTLNGETANYCSKTLSLTAEMAYSWILHEHKARYWVLKPQAQARLYTYLAKAQETNLGSDSRLTQANMRGLATLVGVNFSGKTSAKRGVEPFFELNWYYDSGADQAVKVGKNEFNQSLSKNLFEFNAGLNFKLSTNLDSWVHVGGKMESTNGDYKEIRGAIGIKFSW